MINFDIEYNRLLNVFNGYLEQKFNNLEKSAPNTIKEAMKYAVLDGGKRIRPILCLAFAEAFGIPLERVLDYALAIECIHSYSLVHDDLPCMDNDDYRRGKLSTHKKFGQAMGVLAGDALLNFAFEICLSKEKFFENDYKAMRVIAESAGYNGMIAGQVLDLENEKSNQISEEILYKIFDNKTAKLILAPIMVVSCFIDSTFAPIMREFGYNLGVLFQIEDDILDVEGDISVIGKTPNKDSAVDKLTSVKLFGLNGAKERADLHYERCINALSTLLNNEFLLLLTKKMHNRKK
jgi:geranylgeranyl diphosphate synthase type II